MDKIFKRKKQEEGNEEEEDIEEGVDLPLLPKRTKVQAQRKFAQGSSPMLTPVKEPPAEIEPPVVTPILTPPPVNVNQPKTEDFLNFLCFRGTNLVSRRLSDLFSNPNPPTILPGSHSENNKQGVKKIKKKQLTAEDLKKINKFTKQKTPAAELKKMKKEDATRMRRTALPESLETKVPSTRLEKKFKTKEINKKKPVITNKKITNNKQAISLRKVQMTQRERLKSRHIHQVAHQHHPLNKLRTTNRSGLRSGGILPTSTIDEGNLLLNKSKQKKVKQHEIKTQTRNMNLNIIKRKNENKILENIKKKKSIIKVTKDNKNIKHITTVSVVPSVRPSRKSKEAAAVYMDLLGKEVKNPETYNEDEDDNSSVESFPELPNTRAIERREKQIRDMVAAQKRKTETTTDNKSSDFSITQTNKKSITEKLKLKNKTINKKSIVQNLIKKRELRSSNLITNKMKKNISQKLNKINKNEAVVAPVIENVDKRKTRSVNRTESPSQAKEISQVIPQIKEINENKVGRPARSSIQNKNEDRNESPKTRRTRGDSSSPIVKNFKNQIDNKEKIDNLDNDDKESVSSDKKKEIKKKIQTKNTEKINVKRDNTEITQKSEESTLEPNKMNIEKPKEDINTKSNEIIKEVEKRKTRGSKNITVTKFNENSIEINETKNDSIKTSSKETKNENISEIKKSDNNDDVVDKKKEMNIIEHTNINLKNLETNNKKSFLEKAIKNDNKTIEKKNIIDNKKSSKNLINSKQKINFDEIVKDETFVSKVRAVKNMDDRSIKNKIETPNKNINKKKKEKDIESTNESNVFITKVIVEKINISPTKNDEMKSISNKEMSNNMTELLDNNSQNTNESIEVNNKVEINTLVSVNETKNLNENNNCETKLDKVNIKTKDLLIDSQKSISTPNSNQKNLVPISNMLITNNQNFQSPICEEINSIKDSKIIPVDSKLLSPNTIDGKEAALSNGKLVDKKPSSTPSTVDLDNKPNSKIDSTLDKVCADSLTEHSDSEDKTIDFSKKIIDLSVSKTKSPPSDKTNLSKIKNSVVEEEPKISKTNGNSLISPKKDKTSEKVDASKIPITGKGKRVQMTPSKMVKKMTSKEDHSNPVASHRPGYPYVNTILNVNAYTTLKPRSRATVFVKNDQSSQNQNKSKNSSFNDNGVSFRTNFKNILDSSKKDSSSLSNLMKPKESTLSKCTETELDKELSNFVKYIVRDDWESKHCDSASKAFENKTPQAREHNLNKSRKLLSTIDFINSTPVKCSSSSDEQISMRSHDKVIISPLRKLTENEIRILLEQESPLKIPEKSTDSIFKNSTIENMARTKVPSTDIDDTVSKLCIEKITNEIISLIDPKMNMAETQDIIKKYNLSKLNNKSPEDNSKHLSLLNKKSETLSTPSLGPTQNVPVPELSPKVKYSNLLNKKTEPLSTSNLSPTQLVPVPALSPSQTQIVSPLQRSEPLFLNKKNADTSHLTESKLISKSPETPEKIPIPLVVPKFEPSKKIDLLSVPKPVAVPLLPNNKTSDSSVIPEGKSNNISLPNSSPLNQNAPVQKRSDIDRLFDQAMLSSIIQHPLIAAHCQKRNAAMSLIKDGAKSIKDSQGQLTKTPNGANIKTSTTNSTLSHGTLGSKQTALMISPTSKQSLLTTTPAPKQPSLVSTPVSKQSPLAATPALKQSPLTTSPALKQPPLTTSPALKQSSLTTSSALIQSPLASTLASKETPLTTSASKQISLSTSPVPKHTNSTTTSTPKQNNLTIIATQSSTNFKPLSTFSEVPITLSNTYQTILDSRLDLKPQNSPTPEKQVLKTPNFKPTDTIDKVSSQKNSSENISTLINKVDSTSDCDKINENITKKNSVQSDNKLISDHLKEKFGKDAYTKNSNSTDNAKDLRETSVDEIQTNSAILEPTKNVPERQIIKAFEDKYEPKSSPTKNIRKYSNLCKKSTAQKNSDKSKVDRKMTKNLRTKKETNYLEEFSSTDTSEDEIVAKPSANKKVKQSPKPKENQVLSEFSSDSDVDDMIEKIKSSDEKKDTRLNASTGKSIKTADKIVTNKTETKEEKSRKNESQETPAEKLDSKPSKVEQNKMKSDDKSKPNSSPTREETGERRRQLRTKQSVLYNLESLVTDSESSDEDLRVEKKENKSEKRKSTKISKTKETETSDESQEESDKTKNVLKKKKTELKIENETKRGRKKFQKEIETQDCLSESEDERKKKTSKTNDNTSDSDMETRKKKLVKKRGRKSNKINDCLSESDQQEEKTVKKKAQNKTSVAGSGTSKNNTRNKTKITQSGSDTEEETTKKTNKKQNISVDESSESEEEEKSKKTKKKKQKNVEDFSESEEEEENKKSSKKKNDQEKEQEETEDEGTGRRKNLRRKPCLLYAENLSSNSEDDLELLIQNRSDEIETQNLMNHPRKSKQLLKELMEKSKGKQNTEDKSKSNESTKSSTKYVKKPNRKRDKDEDDSESSCDESDTPSRKIKKKPQKSELKTNKQTKKELKNKSESEEDSEKEEKIDKTPNKKKENRSVQKLRNSRNESLDLDKDSPTRSINSSNQRRSIRASRTQSLMIDTSSDDSEDDPLLAIAKTISRNEVRMSRRSIDLLNAKENKVENKKKYLTSEEESSEEEDEEDEESEKEQDEEEEEKKPKSKEEKNNEKKNSTKKKVVEPKKGKIESEETIPKKQMSKEINTKLESQKPSENVTQTPQNKNSQSSSLEVSNKISSLIEKDKSNRIAESLDGSLKDKRVSDLSEIKNETSSSLQQRVSSPDKKTLSREQLHTSWKSAFQNLKLPKTSPSVSKKPMDRNAWIRKHAALNKPKLNDLKNNLNNFEPFKINYSRSSSPMSLSSQNSDNVTTRMGGKHHNLPLPVEQTLKRLATVSPKVKNFNFEKTNSEQKNQVELKVPAVGKIEDIPKAANTNEQIMKWLNDSCPNDDSSCDDTNSTSKKLQAKYCDDTDTSMSSGVIDKGIVSAPMQLKDIFNSPSFSSEKISSVKVDDYKRMKQKSLTSPSSDKKIVFTSPCDKKRLGEETPEKRKLLESETDSFVSDLSSCDETKPEKRAIFQQRRSLAERLKERKNQTSLAKIAFSPQNESSVYAFEPEVSDTPSTPFRRNKDVAASSSSVSPAPSLSKGDSPVNSSIAVQVNFETETVLECSTQTDMSSNQDDGHLFYIPLQKSSDNSENTIQGVAVKLGTEGPDQRVIMSAKLVTKPQSDFAKPSNVSCLVPQRRVRPFNTPIVGTVQPMTRPSSTQVSPRSQHTQTIRPPPPSSPSSSTSSTSKSIKKTKSKCSQSEKQTQSSSSTTSSANNKHNSFPSKGSQAMVVEAPTFYPTEKEFQDPMDYIEKIKVSAEQFGICKIVPPSSFKPECKLNDDMRFTAYNQYVHKMLHRWGPNVKEMVAIRKYLATQSVVMNQVPLIGGIEVDLPRLYSTVQQCGGLKEVIEKKRWPRVADLMKIPKLAQDRMTKLDDIYCKYLLPYDTLSPDERSKLFDAVEAEWGTHFNTYLDEEEDEEEEENEDDDLDECIVKGRSMPLSAFYRVARNTMAMYFKSESPNDPSSSPSPEEVEKEFWDHVTNRMLHICVHSASIDTGSNGCGFPTAKNSTFAKHPWNLKILTNNSSSILRSLSSVLGITVPSLHLGMLFSACCWYRDPHGLPWIEYLHSGANKIWYGIPDELSTAFRSTMMSLFPHYCRSDKTIWLASDMAMIPPTLLTEKGVSLSRVVQEPGQFIIVFPKAFTSSIATGYLVAESVCFAQSSWLTGCEKVFKDMQDSCEPSEFSLELLLFAIASDSRTHIDVLNQILPMIESIRDIEIALRSQLKDLGIKTKERMSNGTTTTKKGVKKKTDEEEEHECETCRTQLHISFVENSEEETEYCLRHAIETLTPNLDQVKHCKLFYAYDEEELEDIIMKLKDKIKTKSLKKLSSEKHTNAS